MHVRLVVGYGNGGIEGGWVGSIVGSLDAYSGLFSSLESI